MILATEHNIEAENMYNTDETGCVMGHAQSRRVIEIIRHPRDDNGRLFPADLPELNLRPGKGQTLQDGSREFATVICCICADGTFLDSAIIFKAKNLQDNWFGDIDGVPENFLFGVSPNGWTDNSKALTWLERSFGLGSVSEKKATNNDGLQKWRLLMFDGHISHINKTFLHQCLDYQVRLIIVLENCYLTAYLIGIACLSSSAYDAFSTTLGCLSIWSTQICILRSTSSPVCKGGKWCLEG